MKYDTISFVKDEDFAGIAEKAVRCKFVIVVDQEQASLVFGPLSRFSFHADLVERYCTERSIGSRRVGKGDTVEVLDPSVRIAGGGYLTWSKTKSSIRLGGSSKAYGPYELTKLQAILAVSPLFAGDRISIDA